jgi:fructokinase
MSDPKIIVGLGEMLWDMLPGGERLGGAPANFAVMAARLGDRGVIASRLGRDKLGDRALDELDELPIDISFVQRDPEHPTGSVGVEIIEGEPHYTIHEPVAWDFLEWTPEWRALAQSADAVCFGTLAQRSEVSRKTIQDFVAGTRPECIRIFDVNLRPPHFSAGLIAESLATATIFKLNETEVPRVLTMLGASAAPAYGEEELLAAARWLIVGYPLRLVAITMGGSGSLLVSRDSFHRHPGVPAKVVDTVGAGDAFTAALVHSCLAGDSLAQMNEAGNRWGAWVASQPGAMPPLDAATLARITQQIHSANHL